tara:strand:- start:239 stop:874 length:636 start_codon:yes stop_codon:yes gene_type:complete
MAKHTFNMADVTGDTKVIARSSYGYDWNFLADDETLLFGTTDETAFSVKNITPGTGISAGDGTLFKGSILRMGDVIETTIVIDLTGLNSGDADADVIGVAAAANCNLGQITAANNGTILAGTVQCVETPAGGEPDIDLYSAVEATGTEETLITALDETALLAAAADWTGILPPKGLTAVPAADEYLYLVGGGGVTNATYTAGKFVIKLYGY